ncbi:MAG: class I SAM-dependent methyltransferase [Planctomycetota bacterium]|nr:class I SAM-dependent methyltransferase [Planctomycetota bacterium]
MPLKPLQERPADGAQRASAVPARVIARSLDAPASLRGVLDRVFDPLTTLGCQPGPSVALLVRAGLAPGARVLELACGKGALSVELARRLGCRVNGIDAYGPFIEEARSAARRAGVSGRCRFVMGDARGVPPARYDAAVMLNLFPIERAVPLLRRCVRPGGLMLVDDVAGDPRSPIGRRFPLASELARRAERWGDSVVLRRTMPRREAGRQCATYQRLLKPRCAMLARQRPELRGALRELMRLQRASDRLFTGPLRSVMLVLRRG